MPDKRSSETRKSNSTRNSQRSQSFDKQVNREDESDFSESSETDNESFEGNKENQDNCGSALRRSTRQRKSTYDNLNQWIFGVGGPAAPGYPHDVQPAIIHEQAETPNKPIRRSNRLNSGNAKKEEPSFDDYDDMYSRVKRHNLRRQTKRTNYYHHQVGQETVEPVAKRLRDRTKFTKKENETSSLEDYMQRRKQFKKRGRARSSSVSSCEEDRCPANKRSDPTVIGMDKSFKAQQRQFLSDLQPIEVDPSVTFESVGGLSDHINKLKEIALFPLLYKEFYTQRDITPPKGILFYGLPGTGKTLMARALANECLSVGGRKVSFFLRKGADILNRWVGESERQLKILFEQAAVHQPSIIFFDEIDGLAPIRSSKSDQVHNSVVSTLLAELDGVKDRGDIIVIGATNRIDSIDPALRRPGRFDFEIPFFLPGKEARKEILKVHLKNSDGPKMEMALLNELGEKTGGYSGADLKLLCTEASMSSLRRSYPQIYQSKQKLLINVTSIDVIKEDWLSALKVIRPTQRDVEKPVPPQLLPLLRRSFNKVEVKIEEIFPLNSKALLEPSLKRMLVHSKCRDVVEEFIIPGVLHRFECIKIFRFSIHEILEKQKDMEETSAVSMLMSESLKYNDPSILYIPHIDKLSETLSDVSKSLIRKKLISYATSPCLVIATAEDSVVEEFDSYFPETVEVEEPTEMERRDFFKGIFELAVVVKNDPPVVLEELPLAPLERKVWTKEEKKIIEKRENSTLRELRIFLREMLGKLARMKKFVEFTKPVDISEVPDYLDIITNPMDFETMMTRIDDGVYLSAEMFLSDICLTADNALQYNPALTDADKRLRHRARELKDVAIKLIENEMDSDFEDTCQGIISSRRDRETAEIEPQPSTEAKEEEKLNIQEGQPKSSQCSNGSSHRRRRKSAWHRGSVKKPQRKRILFDSTPLSHSSSPGSIFSSSVEIGTPAIQEYKSEMSNLLEKVTEKSKGLTVYEMMEIRYKLFVAVDRHEKNVVKRKLITELQTIVNLIGGT